MHTSLSFNPSPMSESLPSHLVQPVRARVSAVFYPKEGITYEEFVRHWVEVHGKLFMALDIVKKNLTKYEQVCIRSCLQEAPTNRRL